MNQRLFDIVFSVSGLIIMLPLQLLIALAIKLNSRGPVFFTQERVGKNGKIFKIVKFRSMKNTDRQKDVKLTLSNKDPRITRIGYLLRKYKLDEIPQLVNVLLGQMSIVGPRPEVPEYVRLYSEVERKVLNIRPGITDWASIKYIEENEILAKSNNPEKDYINVIMREKLALNMEYLNNYNLSNYLKIIWITILSVFGYKYQYSNKNNPNILKSLK